MAEHKKKVDIHFINHFVLFTLGNYDYGVFVNQKHVVFKRLDCFFLLHY